MLEQKTYKIGDTEYVLQQFPATRGLEIGIHLVKIAMGATKGIDNIGDGDDFLDAEYNPAHMAAGILEQVDEKSTPAFIKSIIQESIIKPEPEQGFSDWYETKFSANIDELYQLLEAVIEHNKYMDIIKKKMAGIIGTSSSSDGKDKESTPSSKDQS